MVNYENEEEHLNIIKDVLKTLFSSTAGSNLTLKGGTALLLYYSLDRFSEDIDLDATKVDIGNILGKYVKQKGYKIRNTKDTNTTQRYMIDYGEKSSLKVEVSKRSMQMSEYGVKTFEGVNVYSLEDLLVMKINAYLSPNRNKIRDLYDISHIYFKTDVVIDERIKRRLIEMFSWDNLEHIDHLIDNHKDVIIPEKNTEEVRISMYSIFDELFPSEKVSDIFGD